MENRVWYLSVRKRTPEVTTSREIFLMTGRCRGHFITTSLFKKLALMALPDFEQHSFLFFVISFSSQSPGAFPLSLILIPSSSYKKTHDSSTLCLYRYHQANARIKWRKRSLNHPLDRPTAISLIVVFSWFQ